MTHLKMCLNPLYLVTIIVEIDIIYDPTLRENCPLTPKLSMCYHQNYQRCFEKKLYNHPEAKV